MTISQRIASVRREMDAACTKVGRDPASARLVVVTKSASPEMFAELAALGVTDLGENRVQGAAERLAGYEHAFRWHFIGHLQSNKVRKAVPLFDVFHGVDSVDLMLRIDRVAGELGRRPELMFQVNVSGEGSKSGLDPADVPAAIAAGAALTHARLTGLMTMAPRTEDPEQVRPVFRALADLRGSLPELSMGMTADFGVAVEEGATWVRVGRQIVAPGIRGVD
jgi:pyridoxal phosphate enzyme (YggS family)